MLLNKERLHVCLDGTFRLSSDRFVVITAGILGKRPPVIWCDFRGRGFPTTFFEGIVAVASSESSAAYCHLMDSFAAAARKYWGVDILEPGGADAERKPDASLKYIGGSIYTLSLYHISIMRLSYIYHISISIYPFFFSVTQCIDC